MTYAPEDFALTKTGPQFAWLEERLKVHGFPSIRLTDDLKDRVQRFQLEQGWSGSGADGLVGPRTLALLTADPAPLPPPNPSTIDLTNWKLTLPVDYNSDGKADEVRQPSLATFKLTPYFYPRVDGGIAFQAPCSGATTSGSTYPRSELREMRNGGYDTASWDSDDGAIHTMVAELAFTHLPELKPHCVGLQIHDATKDICVLRLEATSLYITAGDNSHYKRIASDYKLGTRITVKVEVTAGGTRWYLDGVHVTTISGLYEGAYFKAGCYTQASSKVSKTSDKYGTGYGEVVIYGLKVSHT